MADYFPLLARALDTMSDRGPDVRRMVYERARTALTSQLLSLDPPLGEAELERERHALDDAIARAETTYGADSSPRSQQTNDAPVSASLDSAEATPDRVEPTPTIRRGGPARSRPMMLAIGLFAVMVPVGIVAWLWRDRPATVPAPATTSNTPAPVPQGDAKFSERIGGGDPNRTVGAAKTAPSAASPRPTEPAQAAQPPATVGASGGPVVANPAPSSVPAQPELAVAQRAVLIEENPADPQKPRISAGRTLWRLDGLNGGQGQPLETVVRATIDIPESALSLVLLMRRNVDPAFPASHTLELTFTSTNAGDQNRTVRDVGLPQLKPDETVRGVPLAGLSVPVKENIFLIGLSDLKGDIDRNTDLLVNRNWIDLPVRFVSGQRAVVSFEKGVSGDRVMADAFRQWSQPQ